MSSTTNTDYNPNSKDVIESLDAPTKSSSKYILSQSKKPSGTTIDKPKDTIDLTETDSDKLVSSVNGNDNSSSIDSELEIGVQLKEMRMELERREAEVKDLQVHSFV